MRCAILFVTMEHGDDSCYLLPWNMVTIRCTFLFVTIEHGDNYKCFSNAVRLVNNTIKKYSDSIDLSALQTVLVNTHRKDKFCFIIR